MHMKRPEFSNLPLVSVDHLQKLNNEHKFRETDDCRTIYQNESNKAFFQFDMTYGKFIDDLAKGSATTNVCRIKHLILQIIHNMIDINDDLVQQLTVFLVKNKINKMKWCCYLC